ncbi:importin subunit alpha-1b-like [Sesbania bispinosa]|nr:importin subunit alpha-1b-like [Sesbania bispinosa]
MIITDMILSQSYIRNQQLKVLKEKYPDAVVLNSSETIEEVIQASVVPRFVEFLMSEDFHNYHLRQLGL